MAPSEVHSFMMRMSTVISTFTVTAADFKPWLCAKHAGDHTLRQ